MEYAHDGEPKGFSPDNDISLSDALALVMQMHESARPPTVRKFLIGAALHGFESGLTGYAESYCETFERLDRTTANAYRAPIERFVSIPNDFWRIGMALEEDASQCFAANNLGHITEMSESELPYRLRNNAYGALQNERVALSQMATGVHFPKQKLIALADDPEWRAWGSVAVALKDRNKRGRPKFWKWDEVKVALTIEAARNPSILQSGTGPIAQFINNEMRWRHFEQIPDRKDVDAYVRRFSWLWAPQDEGPP